MNPTASLLALAIGAAVAGSAVAQPSSPGSAAAPVVGTVVTVQGTVRSVDRERRTAVIEGADGQQATLRVGPEVRHFERIAPGDRVTVRHTEAVAHAIAEGSDSAVRQRVEAQASRQAPAGDKPGVSAMRRTTVVANVVEVDREAGRLTIKGTSPSPIRLRVRDPEMLEGIDAGDQVATSYVESTVLSIEPGNGAAAAGSAGAAPAVPTDRPRSPRSER